MLRKTIEIDNENRECAIRLAPYEFNGRLIMGVSGIDSHSMYEDDTANPNELIIQSLEHKNIVKYYEHCFEIINNTLFHVTGMSIFDVNQIYLVSPLSVTQL